MLTNPLDPHLALRLAAARQAELAREAELARLARERPRASSPAQARRALRLWPGRGRAPLAPHPEPPR